MPVSSLKPARLARYAGIAAAYGCAVAAVLPAQTPASAARLTVERIFGSPELFSRGVGQLRWYDDSTYVALQGGQSGAEIARVNARSGTSDVLVQRARG